MLRTEKTLKNGGFPPFFYLFPFYLINFSRKTTFREKKLSRVSFRIAGFILFVHSLHNISKLHF